jgi:hypothetical protein
VVTTPTVPQRTRLLFLYGFVLGTFFAVFNIDVLVLSVFGSILTDTVSALPTYTRSKQVAIGTKIPQVAVLYFAVLIAAVQFMNDDQQFAYESDTLLYFFLPLSIILVALSALSAILTLMGASPNMALNSSLGLMGAAFFISSIATVITGIGKVNERDATVGRRSDDLTPDSRSSNDTITEPGESDEPTDDPDTPETETGDTDGPDKTTDATDHSVQDDENDTKTSEGKEP